MDDDDDDDIHVYPILLAVGHLIKYITIFSPTSFISVLLGNHRQYLHILNTEK